MKGAGNGKVTLVVIASVIFVTVLGLSPSTASAAPSTAGPSVRTIGPGKVVSLAHPPAPAPHRPAGALPFLPRSRTAYEQAKAGADRGLTGGRQGPAVHTIPRAQSQTPTANTTNTGSTATPAIGVSNNFHGDDLATQVAAFGTANQEVTPPDTTLATGNGDVVEPLNDTVSVYGTSGTLRARTDLYTLYGPVLPAGHKLTDTQAVFDSVTSHHRFYMIMLGYDPTTFDSEVLLAVSQTSDPTGSWNLYNVGTTAGVLHDQPFLGLSDDKLTISVNDFDIFQGFLGSTTYVVNKSEADAGGTVVTQPFGPDPYFRPSPARSTSSTTTQYVVANESPNGSPTLDVMAITGVPSMTSIATRTTTSLSITSTTIPPDAGQPSPGQPITTNDDATLESVWQHNVLWVGANDGCTPSGDSIERSCVRLIELTAPTSGTPSVTQDFDAATPGGYLYYPGVALDQSQDLYVPLSFSDPASVSPSALVLALGGGNPNTARVEGLRSGVLYNGLPFETPPLRWGDYSGAAIDPSDPAAVWVATEFGGGDTSIGPGTNWATQLSEVSIAPPPSPIGAPVVTSPQFGVPNQTDVFTVASNGAVQVRWVDGAGAWNGPLPISGPGLAPAGAHLAASPQFGVPNQTDVFVVANGGATQVLWVAGGGNWNGPLGITPGGTALPGAALGVSNQFGIGNQTDVFVVANSGATDVSWVDGGGSWGGPLGITPRGTAPAGAALGVSNQFGIPNQTDVFVVANSGATDVSWVDGGGNWGGPLGITPGGTAPAGASLGVAPQFGVPNQTDVFVVASTGATDVSWVAGAGNWNGPLGITPGGTAPAGAALGVSNQFGIPNQTDVFVVASTGATDVSWVAGAGNWNGPLGITPGGTAPAGAALGVSNQFGIPNQTDVFVVANTGATDVSWVAGGGNWNGPMPI
jgi:hypothetical protein